MKKLKEAKINYDKFLKVYILTCKYCKRHVPNKEFIKGDYCLWCINKEKKNGK